MNLGQLIGLYQMRLSEYEEVGSVALVQPSVRPRPEAPARKAKAWLQDRILAFIDERAKEGFPRVSNPEVQRGLDISGPLATATLYDMTDAKRLVRTGARRHYLYERASA